LLTTPEYVEAGAALTCDLSELALHATKYLCERIMNDLKEPELILTSVGDIVWESNQQTHSVIARTIATLKDFFGDLEDWLISGYYFPKVLKYCFDLTLQTYVESFFSNTMANGVKDPSTAANELDQDYLRLVVFFNGASFEKYHGVAGFYIQSVINERLRILQSLSNLINPEVPADETVDDVKAILNQFQDSENGTPAVLHLVGLRKRHRGNESIDWLRVIAKAKKAMDRDSCRALEPSSSYTVPDLRNSPFLQNIRPVKRDMSRHFSLTSRVHVETTSKILVQSRSIGLTRMQIRRFKAAKILPLPSWAKS